MDSTQTATTLLAGMDVPLTTIGAFFQPKRNIASRVPKADTVVVGRGPVGEPIARVHRKRKRDGHLSSFNEDSQDSTPYASSSENHDDSDGEEEMALLSSVASKHVPSAHALAGSIVGVGEGEDAVPMSETTATPLSKATPQTDRTISSSTTQPLSKSTDITTTTTNVVPSLEQDKETQIPSKNAPYWMYLMSIADEEHYEQKTLTHVGKSRNPIAKVRMHNERQVKSKSTRPAAGLWNLEIAFGPFEHKEDTFAIRDFWKMKKRGPASRRTFGKWIAGVLDMECFDTRWHDENEYLEAWKTSRKKRRHLRGRTKNNV